MGLPVARKWDPDLVHCATPLRHGCAKTVYVNGRGWSCLGHLNTPHLKPCGVGCCLHAAPLVKCSLTVMVEGRMAGRVGDKVGGCTAVAPNDCNVIVG